MKNLFRIISTAFFSNLFSKVSADQSGLIPSGLIPNRKWSNIIDRDIKFDSNGVANFCISEDGSELKSKQSISELSSEEKIVFEQLKLQLRNTLTELSTVTENKVNLACTNDKSNNKLILHPFSECDNGYGYKTNGYNIQYPVTGNNYIAICKDLLRSDNLYDLRQTLAHEFMHALGFGHPHDEQKHTFSINIKKTKKESSGDKPYNPEIESKGSYDYDLVFYPNKPLNSRIKDSNRLLEPFLSDEDLEEATVEIKLNQKTWNSNRDKRFQELNTVLGYSHNDNNIITIHHYKALSINHPENKELAKLIWKLEPLLKAALTFQDIIDLEMKFKGCSSIVEMAKEAGVILEACGTDCVKIKGDSNDKCATGINTGINEKKGNKNFSKNLDEEFRELFEKDLLVPLEIDYKCDRNKFVQPPSSDYIELINFISDLMKNNITSDPKDNTNCDPKDNTNSIIFFNNTNFTYCDPKDNTNFNNTNFTFDAIGKEKIMISIIAGIASTIVVVSAAVCLSALKRKRTNTRNANDNEALHVDSELQNRAIASNANRTIEKDSGSENLSLDDVSLNIPQEEVVINPIPQAKVINPIPQAKVINPIPQAKVINPSIFKKKKDPIGLEL